MKILFIAGFHARQLLRRQPAATLVLLSSILVMIAAGAALWRWQLQSAEVSDSILSMRARAPAAAISAISSGAVPLPRFSSAEFTSQFLSIAREAHVPTDELSYVLETGTAQPYWRYRVTVDLKTAYPELRKFIAALVSELPNVSLDTIRCRREDGTAFGLHCQLAFSAFFQKEIRG